MVLGRLRAGRRDGWVVSVRGQVVFQRVDDQGDRNLTVGLRILLPDDKPP